MLWYPGMEGGRALADILLGRASPTGRLPFAVPRDASHLPHFDRDATEITYDLFHGQWLLDRDGHDARYPFGFGLTYGAPATVHEVEAVAGSGEVQVSARIENGGDRDVTEVIQVYAGARHSGLERPLWRLAAFARIDVPARSSMPLEFAIPYARLAVRADGAWRLEGGTYEIAVARHARDPQAQIVRVALQGQTIPA